MNLIPVVAMLIEPTQISIFLGPATAWSLWLMFELDPLLVLAAHLLLHAAVDYALLRLTQVSHLMTLLSFVRVRVCCTGTSASRITSYHSHMCALTMFIVFLFVNELFTMFMFNILVHSCTVLVSYAYLFVAVQNAPLPFGPHVFVAAWVMQQLVEPLVYVEALLNLHHVSWGRRRFRLQWGAQATLEPERARAACSSTRA